MLLLSTVNAALARPRVVARGVVQLRRPRYQYGQYQSYFEIDVPECTGFTLHGPHALTGFFFPPSSPPALFAAPNAAPPPTSADPSLLSSSTSDDSTSPAHVPIEA